MINPIDKNNDLATKRYAARLAMEGEAEKARREKEEFIAKERELAKQLSLQKEQDKKAAEERAMRDKAAAEERERLERERSAANVRGEVEKIKNIGAQTGSLRTLRGDMDEMIREQNVTIARIAMQEEERRRKLGISSKNDTPKSLALWIASGLFLTAGIGAGAYIYINYYLNDANLPETIIKTRPKEIISIESIKEVIIPFSSRTKSLSAIKEAISSAEPSQGGIMKLDLKKEQAGIDAATIDTSSFLSLFSSSVPGDLSRSLEKEMLLGVIRTIGGNKSAFLLAKVDLYQNAFAGMLKWEKGSLIKDLYETLSLNPANDYLITKNFEDSIIENQDTRILKNESGETVFIYSFFNGKYLIISSNSDAHIEVLNRLRNTPNI